MRRRRSRFMRRRRSFRRKCRRARIFMTRKTTEKEKYKENGEREISEEGEGEANLAIVRICMFMPNIRVKGSTTPEEGLGGMSYSVVF